mgnify:CR=1 FL=1
MVDVILVNEQDQVLGQKEKIKAHKDGDLHRAFSVILYNAKGEMFIHKRATSKYHCGGLWTNACCSHPFPNEDTAVAANRRLFEELGYSGIDLIEKFSFVYKSEFDNGLTEHEFDYVFTGVTDNDPPDINKDEIADWKWVSVSELTEDITKKPGKYTVWFKDIMKRLKPII